MKLSEAYETLQIDHDADLEAIKQAYRRRALETHPDKRGDHHEFVRVQAAYEIVCEFLKSPAEVGDMSMPAELRELVDQLVQSFRDQFKEAHATCASRFKTFRRTMMEIVGSSSRGELKKFGATFRESWNEFVRDLFHHFNDNCRQTIGKYESWFDDSLRDAFKEVNSRRTREMTRRPAFYVCAAILLVAGVLRSAGMDYPAGFAGTVRHLWTAIWPVALTPLVYWGSCALMWERPRQEERLDVIPFKLDRSAEFQGSAALKESAERARGAGWGGAFAGQAFGGAGFLDPLTGAVIGFAIGSIVERLVNPTEKVRKSIFQQLEQFCDAAEPDLTAYVVETHRVLMEELRGRVISNYNDRVRRVARLLARA